MTERESKIPLFCFNQGEFLTIITEREKKKRETESNNFLGMNQGVFKSGGRALGGPGYKHQPTLPPRHYKERSS